MAGHIQNFTATLDNLCNEKDLQIIIIHDIQDLKTGPEIRKILRLHQNSPIIFIEKYIGSPGGARNLGIDYAKGMWLNFVDSDDLFNPIELLKVLRASSSNSIDAYISNYESLNSITKDINHHEHRENWTRVAMQPGLWRWTFRNKSIGNTRFSNLSMGEDQKFLYDFCKQKKIIIFTNLTTYRYTQNQAQQLTNQITPKHDLYQVLSEILAIRSSHQKNYDEFTETILVKLLISTIIHSTLWNKLKSFVILFKILIPFSKVRLRYGKLDIKNWLCR